MTKMAFLRISVNDQKRIDPLAAIRSGVRSPRYHNEKDVITKYIMAFFSLWIVQVANA